MTFQELYLKTNINTILVTTVIVTSRDAETGIDEGVKLLSHLHTPTLSIYTGLIMSMNVPYIFPPLLYENNYYVDGGVLNNFPMELLSENALGLCVLSREINNINSIFSFSGKLFDIICNYIKKLKPTISNQFIINLNADDYGIVDFDINLDDKITLYKRGYDVICDHETRLFSHFSACVTHTSEPSEVSDVSDISKVSEVSDVSDVSVAVREEIVINNLQIHYDLHEIIILQ